jgi:glycosyltransferase involved in cell wall biosynthesis
VEVTVLIVTYNHEKYIAQALDGILMQATDFAYEIVVIEDCSTDATRQILRAYQLQHPAKIRLRLAARNRCSNKAFVEEFETSSSSYIAILDGDDYWTSPNKLQKQVEFLRAHPDCVLCFHNAMNVYEDDRLPTPYNPANQKAFSGLEDIWRGCFIASATPMFRKKILKKFPQWYSNLPYGDWPLHILYAEHGGIGYIDEILAVHRIHGGGVWSKQNRIQRLESLIAAYESVNANLKFRYNDLAQLGISKWKNDLESARRVTELAAAVLPPEATVIIMNPPHEDVPQIAAREVWTFPQRIRKESRQLFASGATGSAEATWIQADCLYKFSLYSATSKNTLLASVSVAQDEIGLTDNHSSETPGENQAFITAAPNPVPRVRDQGETIISWSTGDGSPGRIYVSIEDRRMHYPADGPEAIEQVETLRNKGADFLVAPLKASELFERYRKLKEYLDNLYSIVKDDEFCRIYDLRTTIQKPAAAAQIVGHVTPLPHRQKRASPKSKLATLR